MRLIEYTSRDILVYCSAANKSGIFAVPLAITSKLASQASLLRNRFASPEMNSTIIASNKHAYHTVANAEFTAVYDRMVYNFAHSGGTLSNYHFFIRYGDKVYMEVKGIGEIVMSFAELQKNRYWYYYYNLSQLLTKDKHLVIQDLKYSSDYLDNQIYAEDRYYSIDTAFIEFSLNTRKKKIIDDATEPVCYYRINPFDLERMEYSTAQELKIFDRIYMTRAEFKNKVFDKVSEVYNELVIGYQAASIEKELNKLSAIFEDKKHIINLAAIYDKQGMDGDVLAIIYKNLVSANGYDKYKGIISELGNYGRLESVARILEV